MSSRSKVRCCNPFSHDNRVKAAKAAVGFIRKQAIAFYPLNEEELCKAVWTLYWKLHKAGVLVAPRLTRSLLREKYGFWKQVGVEASA